MSISVLVQKEIVSGHQQILGVYSNPQKAYEIFKQRFQKNHYPFTGGIWRYSDAEMFNNMLNEATHPYILIYENDQFQIFVQWNILDQLLPS